MKMARFHHEGRLFSVWKKRCVIQEMSLIPRGDVKKGIRVENGVHISEPHADPCPGDWMWYVR